MLRLDFHDRPLGEVVKTLNERHDLRLSLRLEPLPRRGRIMAFPNPDRVDRLKELTKRPITLEAPSRCHSGK